MRKKVKGSAIPMLVHEIINMDTKYFSLKKETLCNMVVQGLGFERLTDIGSDILDKTKSLSFNLNDINTELFPEMLKQSRARTESEFIRRIFFTYINLHPCLRERILHKSIFMEIERAILNKRKLKIYFNKNILDVLPIALERNPETGFNSLKAQVGTETFLYEMKGVEKILK